MTRFKSLRIGFVAALAAGCITTTAVTTTITVNTRVTYQKFEGWEAAMLQTALDYKPFFPAFNTVLDGAASDLGVTRIRLTVTPGVEHPPGYGQQYLDGNMTEPTLIQQYAYNIINDNNDPNVANLAGFEFTLLDWRIENLVLPFKERLAARGEKLYLYISYTDFGASPFEHKDNPAEYAEFMHVIFDHLKSKYGLIPDGINVMNEPDQTPWTAAQVGQVIASTGTRLRAAGYNPEFMAASTVDRGKAVSYFESVIAVSAARPFVTDLSYHCYNDTGTNSWQRIAEASARYRVGVVMNECYSGNNNAQALSRDLKLANATAWQQGPFNGSNGYYATDRATQRASLNGRTRLLRQYYHYIRPGAIRVEASSNDSSFDPVAFVNANGALVVVIRAGSGAFAVENLPAGSYDVSYTTERDFDVHLPRVTLRAGDTYNGSIPQSGVLTIASPQAAAAAGGGRTGPPTGKAVPRNPR